MPERLAAARQQNGAAIPTQVIRVGALFVLLLIAPAHAQTVAAAAGVRSGARRPMSTPRRSPSWRRARWSPCRCSQLTVWGLRGLTALDPELTARAARRQASRSRQRDRVMRRDRRQPEPTSAAGRIAAADLALAAAGSVPASPPGPARRASCRASSTSCSTTSIPIPATCRRARRARIASAASGQAGPGSGSSGADL